MSIFIARAPPTRKTQAIAVAALLCFLFSAGRVAAQSAGLEKIQHVIVIYQENWSFDGLYGKFPGADGLANAGERIRQMKKGRYALPDTSAATRYVEEAANPRFPVSDGPTRRSV